MILNVIFTNDAIVAAILFLVLAVIFHLASSNNALLRKLFQIFPPILLCYFIPGLLNSFGIISGSSSGIYPFVSRYLLPVCLVLFTLSLDVQMIKKLGWKALLVFLSGTVGVILGGPIAVKIVSVVSPQVFEGAQNTDLWKGLGTIAGSWIGGGANQTALKEIFQPSDYIFSQTVAVDVLVAEALLAVLLVGVGYSDKINKWLKADTSIVEDMKKSLDQKQKSEEKIPQFNDYLNILSVGFICTGLAYLLAEFITPYFKNNFPESEKFSLTSTFFWVVFFVTLFGVILSRTRARNLQNVGATKIGSIILYILVASIGMQMDLFAIAENLGLFMVGIIWILFHIVFIVIASRILKVPYFVLAVGSQANIGGAASASVVAGAFHPTLVSIGVIFSVLGYAIGTYGGYLTAILIRWVLL